MVLITAARVLYLIYNIIHKENVSFNILNEKFCKRLINMMNVQAILCRQIRRINNVTIRSYCEQKHNQNPYQKTLNTVSSDISSFFGINKKPSLMPEHADVVIIGGGFIGASTAYWLKTRAGNGLSVVVLEKDFSYQSAQNNSPMLPLTQHFSLPENIYLSQFAVDFLRNIKTNLKEDIDVQFCPNGYLLLASEKYADRLEQNVTLLKEHGIVNELLTPKELKKRYPWLRTDDITLGCISSESAGVFNSWQMLKGLVKASKKLDATYVNAEVVGFEMEQQRDVLIEGVKPGQYQRINQVKYKTPDGKSYCIKFAACILAAGVNSNEIAKMAGIGVGDGLLSEFLPLETRKFRTYAVTEKTPLSSPLVMDTSGIWFRRNGFENNIVCGHIPIALDKQLTQKDYEDQIVRPSLRNRLPNCEKELKTVSTDVYDRNVYDETGILGPHPYHNNLYVAAGFGKLGCTHAPGIGRSIAEMIVDSQFTSIDLTRFGFDRVLMNEPLMEFNIY